MTKFTGKGVYGAYAIGKISVLKDKEIEVKRQKIEDVEAELKRFEKAKQTAVEQLQVIYDKAVNEVGEEDAQIFEIHMMLIEDEDYNDAIKERIEQRNLCAEYAVFVTGEDFSDMFKNMDDSYMQARSADIKDISNRIVACLTNASENELSADEKVIICAKDLVPSETVSLDKEKVLAFVTAHGSANSHTAILAKNMNIPAVIGVGEEFLEQIADGDVAVVNGFTGEFIVNPDIETIAYIEKKNKEERDRRALLEKLKGKENVTLDGTEINIYANIGSVNDIEEVVMNDAGGIGLFRSEFLYLENTDYPTEDEQFEVYKKVLQSMKDKKVIIRTLDIGADKQADYFELDKEENPALGLRAIRFCLTRPEIFETQLRALYRASVYGNLGIMFPMIASVAELKEALLACEKVKIELDEEGIEYSKEIEVGIMIETPAAAIISDVLATMVDFFSIGTNDLTQYTLACDRQNPKIDRFCDTHHESILRLIEMTVKNAHENGIWAGICGELAADTTLTKHFIRMGVDELSVSPSFVLKVRDMVRSIDLNE